MCWVYVWLVFVSMASLQSDGACNCSAAAWPFYASKVVVSTVDCCGRVEAVITAQSVGVRKQYVLLLCWGCTAFCVHWADAFERCGPRCVCDASHCLCGLRHTFLAGFWVSFQRSGAMHGLVSYCLCSPVARNVRLLQYCR